MKRILALLLTLALVFAFAACGGDTEEATQDASDEAAETEVVEEEGTDGALESGMSGVGEKEFDTEFFTLTVPQDIHYELYFYSVTADTCTGTIQLDLGEYNTLEARLEVTTTRMVSSLDDAVEECIATKNLDTYENGSYEDLGSTTINGVEYRSVKIITDYSESTYLVTYYQRESDGVDMYVELQLNDVSVDTEYIQTILGSISYK